MHCESQPTRPGRANARPGFGTFALALATLLTLWPATPPRAQGTLSAIEADVDAISRQARPSLVTVIAQRTVAARARAGAAPRPRLHSRVGSGVAVESHVVLTTASVTLGSEKIIVVTDNGLQVEARLVGMDPIHNVSVLAVDGLEIPPLAMATRAAQPGDWVIALGSSYRAAPTQSVGNISYRYREPHSSLLQLTNAVYPGNSGGAALNSRGELIGLVQGELGAPEGPGAVTEDSHRPTGMSFVLPIEDVAPVYRTLRRDGRPHLGFLGVSTKASYVDASSDPNERVPLGALVEVVQPGGAAEQLGLRKGDLIVAYEGERVEYPEQLARWVAATNPGTLVNFVWVRDEMRRSGRVALRESPTPIPSWMQVSTSVSSTTAVGGTGTPRVAELEARVRKLNREIEHLRGQQDSAR